MSKHYQELTSRNLGLINPKEQKRIKETTILFIGCGLGSRIASLAARTGFENFVLCDGDKVELSNLNRQDFTLSEVGKNKASETKKKILKINPDAKIECVKKFIRDDADIKKLVGEADIAFNMSDPDKAMYKINNEAVKQNKTVFFPINLGHGGFLLIFTKKSKSLEQILGEKVYGNAFYLKLIEKVFEKLPDSLAKLLSTIDQRVLTGEMPSPQTGVTSYITSALAVVAMTRYINKENISLAPNPIFLEP